MDLSGKIVQGYGSSTIFVKKSLSDEFEYHPADSNTAWKVSKYRVIFGTYFPVFGLNNSKSPYSVQIQENTDQN